MPSKIRKKSSNNESNRNTHLFKWADISEQVQQHLFEFLSPSTALKMIVTCKQNMKLYGKYIIQRFQNEKFKYKAIQTKDSHTLALMEDGSLYAWGRNTDGQLGLGHNLRQNTPQLINPSHFHNEKIKNLFIQDIIIT